MSKSIVNTVLVEKAMPLLQCPGCRQGNPEYNGSKKNPLVICTECRREYPIIDGIVDFFPEYTKGKGLAQKLMETKSIVFIYEKYWRPAFTAFGSPVKYEEEETWLKSVKSNGPVDRILDLATGTGRYARILADIYKPDIVLAFDISMPMLKRGLADSLSRGYTNIVFIRGDARCLPFASGSIDRINCFGALHLFPDPYGALEELSRVGINNTVFSCLTSCREPGFIAARFHRVFSKIASFRFFKIEELEYHLEELGFTHFQSVVSRMVLMFSAQLIKKQKEPG